MAELGHEDILDLSLEILRRFSRKLHFRDQRILRGLPLKGGDNLIGLSFPYPLEPLQILYCLFLYVTGYLPYRLGQGPDRERRPYVLHRNEQLEELFVQLRPEPYKHGLWLPL